MNRKAKRALKARASKLGAQMAARCYDCTPAGDLVQVSDPEAVLALEAAFVTMLQQGGMPLVVRLSQAAAAGFPRQDPKDVEAAAVDAWLAVGLDVDGRGTFCLRRIRIATAAITNAQHIAELAMLGELAVLTSQAGFTIGQTMGGVQ